MRSAHVHVMLTRPPSCAQRTLLKDRNLLAYPDEADGGAACDAAEEIAEAAWLPLVPDELPDAGGACLARDEPAAVARRAEVDACAGNPAVAGPAARNIGDEGGGAVAGAPEATGVAVLGDCVGGGGAPVFEAGGVVCAAHAPPPMTKDRANADASRFRFMASLRG